MTTDTEANPPMLDPHPSEQTQAPLPVMPAFKLEVGREYKLYCKLIMKVVHEERGRYLGMVPSGDGLKSLPTWYFSDGLVERNLDHEADQDPYDVKGIHRLPDTIYLIRNGEDYTSNNCFMSYEKAAAAAQARGGYIVEFQEVIGD